jgi:hypothetical protein
MGMTGEQQGAPHALSSASGIGRSDRASHRAVIDVAWTVVTTEGCVRHQLDLSMTDAPARRLYFEVLAATLPPPVSRLDFAAVALVMFAMREGRDLHLRGDVSRRLLANLVEYQRVWALWMPDVYRLVEITCDRMVEEPPSARRRAVCAFSGGVDATFAALYHADGIAKVDRLEVASLMLVHGFDIRLEATEAFSQARATGERAAQAMGTPLVIVRTNFREATQPRWEEEFGVGVCACLHLFASECDTGVIALDEDHKTFIVPWGSSPITNPMLSSGGMLIVSEGGGFTRTQKVAHIARNRRVADNLRVCWEGPVSGKNCGICEKCVRTQLNFLAAGYPIPSGLGAAPTPARVLGVNLRFRGQIVYFADIVEHGVVNGMQRSLIIALRVKIFLASLKYALRQRFRKSWIGRGWYASRGKLRGMFGGG